ncbi:MAG: hypothetical protein EAZ51_06655 [Sphingobacteriales bacterium]|nr:MAG: hypothetical protein EAZ64_00075 [Sphingobacteriales bacterium]TAF80119.1 MAG: hypothetical protein EAZ51_06655 [Sphingobacteriales bacterium]
MKQEEILKKVGQIIDDLKDQHQYLSETQNYNLLELELFTANADFLIDHIEILKKLQIAKKQNNTAEEPIKPAEETEPETPVEITTTIETSITQQVNHTVQAKANHMFELPEKPEEMMFEFEQNIEVQHMYDRELSAEESKLLQEKQDLFAKLNVVNTAQNTFTTPYMGEPKVSDITQPEDKISLVEQEILEINPAAVDSKIINQTPNIKPENSIEAVENEVLQEKKITLNEFLSPQNNNQNISSRLSSMATSDLKSAISLNDKMIFIKQLFNGYNLAYSEAIEILNRLDSFESADNFLQKNYAIKNKWLDKQEVVDRFYEILNRRYVN